MLLEEAVLFLLRRSGYVTVESHVGDPTLRPHQAGIAVVGRGAIHQIDAIADYLIGQPFSHPQRLLVEAKFHNSGSISLTTIRNAVGVLKDVSEFWSTVDSLPATHRRYHYQKAVFSATPFSPAAESYAFAHDIYLFPMASSAFARPIVEAIKAVSGRSLVGGGRKHIPIELTRLRRAVRESLRAGELTPELGTFMRRNATEWPVFIREVIGVGSILVGMIARSFPVFLVPAGRNVIDNLEDRIRVEIKLRRGRWFIRRPGGPDLFSFDLPPVLFTLYGDTGILGREQAAALKQDWMTDFQALIAADGQLRVVQFDLDPVWLDRLREDVRRKVPEGELLAAE
ncbi:MAG: hypothetical protein ACJ8J0_26985 [Longimicrobiaceae bacterium]